MYLVLMTMLFNAIKNWLRMKYPIELKLELEDVTYIRDLLEINADLSNDKDDVKQSNRLADLLIEQTYLWSSL